MRAFVRPARGPVHRPYEPGEDMVKLNAGVVVCQGPGRLGRSRYKVCGKAVEKTGRHRLTGGWHDVYDCPDGHRFGIKTTEKSRQVMDIATVKPVFGESLPF